MTNDKWKMENGKWKMKSLLNSNDKRTVIERLRQVTPDSRRRWGKMSAHQMLCHLSDSFLAVMGEKEISPATGPLQRTLVKWIALYAPLPWPKGVETRPEVDQEIGGTRPAEFDRDRQQLEKLIDRFSRRPRDFAWRPHPIFSLMSERDWMRWGYLHLDHHLRQFGA